MGLDLNYRKGQTPINEGESEGLLITVITTMKELDEFEQLNIQEAVEFYLYGRKFSEKIILTEKFIKDVHKKMFVDVWGWAGKFRKSNKNIGTDWHQISVRLKQLIENCKYWIKNKTFLEEEIAIRFKHELVAIHPFPNGNGRHSRLLSDIIMKHIFKAPAFSWGRSDLINNADIRSIYIKALQKGDNGDFNDLIAFSKK